MAYDNATYTINCITNRPQKIYLHALMAHDNANYNSYCITNRPQAKYISTLLWLKITLLTPLTGHKQNISPHSCGSR